MTPDSRPHVSIIRAIKLLPREEQQFQTRVGAEILDIRMPFLYIREWLDDPPIIRRIRIIQEDTEIQDLSSSASYIGHYMMTDSGLVYHVFDEGEET